MSGWGASGRVWERQAAAFGHRVTVLTPTVPIWDVDGFQTSCGNLRSETVVVGWSLGGMLLLEALDRLVGPPPGGWSWWGWPRSITRRPGYPRGPAPRQWCGPCAGR